jgi:aminoglycoside 2'-N-acetyltransferase I
VTRGEPRGTEPILRTLASDELRSGEVAAIRRLLDAAWADDSGAFTEEDWDHAVGGVHLIIEEGEDIVAHASVVERDLYTGRHRLTTGYVEAVATRPTYRGRGHGTALMREAGGYIDRTFQLGALDTGVPAFYERLGWVVWRGPTFVRTGGGLVRTEEEDGLVLVRLTPTSPKLDLSAAISCDWRPGDVW